MDDPIKSNEPKTTKPGYCNPPEQTRFKSGKSGNPRGRPKGSLNVASVLAKVLRERVVINENGKRKSVTKLEAAIKQLMNRAASGDLKAVALLTALVRSAEERSNQTAMPNSEIEEVDEKVLNGILKRLESTNDGGDKDV